MRTPISLIIEAVEINLIKIKQDKDKIHPVHAESFRLLIEQNEVFLDVLKKAKNDEKKIIIETFENGADYGYSIGIFQKANNVVLDESSFISGKQYYEQNFTNENEQERTIETNKQSN